VRAGRRGHPGRRRRLRTRRGGALTLLVLDRLRAALASGLEPEQVDPLGVFAVVIDQDVQRLAVG
jgi:hypothetical protein